MKRAVAVMLGAWCFLAASALAQDEAIPRPNVKTASATRPAVSAAPLSGATLLILCDVACDWKLDGDVAKGHIEAGGSAKILVDLGQHVGAADTKDGQDSLRQIIEVEQSGQTLVSLELKSLRDAREAKASWTDMTGLVWRKQDNGSYVTWQQAMDYCRTLSLNGSWRLPTIDELQGIYDASNTVPGQLRGRPMTLHVKGNLNLSGCLGVTLGEYRRRRVDNLLRQRSLAIRSLE